MFSIESILITLKPLQTLSDKDPKDWPSLQLVKNRIHDQSEYQGVTFAQQIHWPINIGLSRKYKIGFNGLICSFLGLYWKYNVGSEKKSLLIQKKSAVMIAVDYNILCSSRNQGYVHCFHSG